MVRQSPQDSKNKEIFSSNLNQLMKMHSVRQIDLHNQLDIPKSTLTGYVKGTSLPNKENVEKLAKFFHVDKAEIDPRFSTEKDTTITEDDLEKALDNAHSFDGKPMDDHDRQIIKDILRGYFKNKD